MCGLATELQVLGENVGRADPKVWPEEFCGLLGYFGQVTLKFRLRVAPREVGVRLLEPDLAKGVHHRWSREGFGQEDDFWVCGTYLTD